MQTAKIFIGDLKVHTYIGIEPWEKKQKQDIFIDLQLQLRFSDAPLPNHLGATVDYAHICQGLQADLSVQSFDLLEEMAEQIFSWLEPYRDRIKRVHVVISKPIAASNLNVGRVGFQATRRLVT